MRNEQCGIPLFLGGEDNLLNLEKVIWMYIGE